MPTSIDVELILRTIDEAGPEWQQNFKTTPHELTYAIGELFHNCTQALIQLSILADDNDQVKQDRLNAERIVLKLKELRHFLGDLWPPNTDSFGRDIFDVGPYHVEAGEFFHPVPFYPGDDFIMKLYRWSVYDTNRTVVYRYYLERSEMTPGEPYYVLGKSYSNGHSQIQPYGATAPDYNQMKIHVMNDLNGQGPSPVISYSYQN
ncbi:unnamed protein product [Didymodactylos carnosus]|uniref:Uncharacterized protein n=1 Tax=Didymodactylos carnosus TaxID=1234261 RepID=A0A815JJ15_9BILA|nr:unnamed protein product [Didymodactylos carnosus]CAF1380269.1 unnamed protein product [Didymodactylos carnosus]CAF3608830.1 unnamed protein product [Didymodactylos carnosus]CAF4274326.1 unnamed protein product [Didymodactylos carnosus]